METHEDSFEIQSIYIMLYDMFPSYNDFPLLADNDNVVLNIVK